MRRLLTVGILSLCLAALMGGSIAIAGAEGVGLSSKASFNLWALRPGETQELFSTVRDALPWDCDVTLIFPFESGALQIQVGTDLDGRTVGALVLGPQVVWREDEHIQIDLQAQAWWPMLLITGYVDSGPFPEDYHAAASLN